MRAGGREIVADEAVVDATGIWSRGFSARVGVALPMLPVQQSYLVTEALPSLDTRLPILRDFHDGLLVREDAGQLTVAALSARERLCGVNGIPADFCFDELPTHEAAIESAPERIVHRVPALARLERRSARERAAEASRTGAPKG